MNKFIFVFFIFPIFLFSQSTVNERTVFVDGFFYKEECDCGFGFCENYNGDTFIGWSYESKPYFGFFVTNNNKTLYYGEMSGWSREGDGVVLSRGGAKIAEGKWKDNQLVSGTIYWETFVYNLYSKVTSKLSVKELSKYMIEFDNHLIKDGRFSDSEKIKTNYFLYSDIVKENSSFLNYNDDRSCAIAGTYNTFKDGDLFSNNISYKGDIKTIINNKSDLEEYIPHGYGTEYIKTVIPHNSLCNSYKCDHGTVEYVFSKNAGPFNFAEYTGYFKNGLSHGEGVYRQHVKNTTSQLNHTKGDNIIDKNYFVFEGNWQNGVINGYGTMKIDGKKKYGYWLEKGDVYGIRKIDKPEIINFIPLIKTHNESNTYYIELEINGVLKKVRGVLDTGADILKLSPEFAYVLLNNKTISQSDITGISEIIIANGEQLLGLDINIKSLKIGEYILENVKAVVMGELGSGVLVGGNILKRFGKISIDYNQDVLIIE